MSAARPGNSLPCLVRSRLQASCKARRHNPPASAAGGEYTAQASVTALKGVDLQKNHRKNHNDERVQVRLASLLDHPVQ